ncbi:MULTISPECIES: ATPase, T2SS/T4P/T4SS family [Enterobacter]|uniref:ATPase, T2SS/T4P/T4SS family n=1 Tax=Enterobacter soli TaxID=885040 RepID=A0AAW8HEZ5_9ENTR|nr:MULTISPECIES: ATPase, T2SS/T4P/T4SS family [Enterobacter]EFE5937833.1 Flp pilus assembly complex ATPase component [Escherichia coli]EIZ2433469.1 Flp pilus assembly complex ATPase component TadA [Cronobacter sakazakii]EIZ2458083.1 Flp pilus assembly complex ATPase component TadA [Cronobacter sakazakii]EIZ9682044.1 Flp pilus assembly complex ATPase component TadA [Cronobacter sakazakii]EIZ9687488.1 Flp pilus assembly complex ATPase component TadA [Cronobacter sakazakii]
MNKLNDLDFIDLLLGKDYSEIKGLKGAASFITDLPEQFLPDANKLKNECLLVFQDSGKTEFSLQYEGRVYRITVLTSVFDGISFVMRQTPKNIVDFSEIAFSTDLRHSIELPSATGLCLIAGEMGCGKTTTAASVLKHRIETTGSLGVSIEDPIETLLNGRHGTGRCMQMEVGQHESYSSATKKAWRTGASCLLLGEIRDSHTAHEVLKASLTMFVVSTIHASSIFDAIERYVMFCEEVNPNAKNNIANTLYIIAHQTMNPVIRNNAMIGRNIDINAYNLFHSTQRDSIRTKISNGNYKTLADDFNRANYKIKGD